MNAFAEQVITHFTEHCRPVLTAAGTPVHSSDRQAWLELRRTMVTASDIAALMGLDPRRDALSVFLSKKLPPGKETLTWEDPRFWGLELEQAIAGIVARYCEWEFHPGGYLLQSKRYPVLGATLDGEVKPANENWRPYEGKNVSTWLNSDWDATAQTPPDRVLIQAQTQMMITGADAVQVFALIGGNQPCSIEVAPHQGLRDAILAVAEDLIDRLKRDDPYPATYKSTEAVEKAYPTDNGKIVPLHPEATDLVERCSQATRQRIEIERGEQGLRNQLKMLMGEALYGTLAVPAMIEVQQNGKIVDREIRYVKCGVEPRKAHFVEESFPRILRFVKDLPKELQPNRGRRR